MNSRVFIAKNRILFFLIITFVFFVFRLQHLEAIPVFGDEAIYLRWSQLIRHLPQLRFIPQSDGKQPLFMWLTAISMKYIPDPLLAGRLISILAGFVILLALFYISLIFFNLTTAYIAIILYLFLPLAFFYDRLALADNLLSSFALLCLFFSFLLAKFPRLDISFLLGFSLGLAWLSKSPAVYFLTLALPTFLFLNPRPFRQIYLPLISLFIAYLIYNILRLGPDFHLIAIRNRDYVWPLAEVLKHPLDPLKPHLFDIVAVYWRYLGPVIFAIFLLPKRNRLNKFYFAVVFWYLLPLLATASLTKVFTSRYILFTLPPLILILAWHLDQWHFRYKYPALFLLLLSNLVFFYRLSYDPFNLRLLPIDSGYLQDWTSGWGIKPIAQYLIERSKSANVIVGTEGHFGTLPQGLQIYTDRVDRLTVIGVGLGFTSLPQSLINAKNFGDEVYLLINQSRLFLNSVDLSKINPVIIYPKPNQDKLILFSL